MNAMSMNALGTFDPRDAMERWNQQTQNAQQNALMPSGGDAISFLPQPVQISGPMMPAMPQPVTINGPGFMQPPQQQMMPDFGMMDSGSGYGANPPGKTSRWQMGEDGRLVDPTTGQHKITGVKNKIPFGGFRAKGGPVMPGQAYVVGENRPELFVPTQPGVILPSTGATSSPMNRPYAELAGSTTGSLANRAAVPKGRPMTAQRRFEQASRRAYSQGDLAGSAQLLGLSERLGMGFPMPMRGGLGGLPMLPPAGMGDMPAPKSSPLPGMPPRPGAPAPNSPPQPTAMDTMPEPGGLPTTAAAEPPPSFENWFNASPLAGSGPPPMQAPPMQVPSNTPPAMLDALNQGSFAGVYGRAPAPVSTMPIPGTDYVMPIFNGKPSNQTLSGKPSGTTAYNPVQGAPGIMVPTGPGADKLPAMQQAPNPGWSVTGQPKTKLQPVGGDKPPAMPKFETDAQGRYFWFESNGQGGFRRRFVDENGDGVPDMAPGAAGAAAAANVPAWKNLK